LGSFQICSSYGSMTTHWERCQSRLAAAKNWRSLISKTPLSLLCQESLRTLLLSWFSTLMVAQWRRVLANPTLEASAKSTQTWGAKRIGSFLRSSCSTTWPSGSTPQSRRKIFLSKLKSCSVALRTAIVKCSKSCTEIAKWFSRSSLIKLTP